MIYTKEIITQRFKVSFMLTRYGFGSIQIGDDLYKISPTFQNIDKLGTPKEIIGLVKSFAVINSLPWLYMTAVDILNACCEPQLPERITGRFKHLNGKLKLVNPPPEYVIHDIIAIAGHCIKHGVVGAHDIGGGGGEPMREFDAYMYIGLAQKELGKTREQAADMTMTEFLMMWDIAFPEAKKKREERLTKDEQQRLMDYQDELDRKAALKRAAKTEVKQ